METVEEVLELLATKVAETQHEIDAAEAAGETSELEYLEGLMEAYTLIETAIEYQRANK